jgi:hypothetical protein
VDLQRRGRNHGCKPCRDMPIETSNDYDQHDANTTIVENTQTHKHTNNEREREREIEWALRNNIRVQVNDLVSVLAFTSLIIEWLID